ncbi:unnamed protein product, partial [Brassica oleracea var. botrytis]
MHHCRQLEETHNNKDDNAIRYKPPNTQSSSLLEASSDSRFRFGRRLRSSGQSLVEILRLLVRQLWMLRLVMDLHRLQIRRRDLAVRTLVLRVAAFLLAGPVGEPRLSSASVGQRRVGLGLELLRRVLLR